MRHPPSLHHRDARFELLASWTFQGGCAGTGNAAPPGCSQVRHQTRSCLEQQAETPSQPDLSGGSPACPARTSQTPECWEQVVERLGGAPAVDAEVALVGREYASVSQLGRCDDQ